MEKLKLMPIDFENEIGEILEWDKEFRGTPKYDAFEKFLFEDGTILGMQELIKTNYEQFPIGEDERKLILVAKNKLNKIVGFTIQSVFRLESESPEVFLQYIVVHPDFQNKGVGTFILSNLGQAIKTYVGKMPTEIFSNVERTNLASQKLFKKFGFEFLDAYDGAYVVATGQTPGLGKTFE